MRLSIAILARVFGALLALGLTLTPAHGQGAWETTGEGLAPIPPLHARVTDLTNTLSAAERDALESKLAAWEQKTGNQLAVLMVPSTKPE
ncbi:MAG TPA: TPM domain-containing protein, partial [Casimicrobiaceae bacterium]|nr:TPM domain-containing protein [Casimicrobiaceae bacterium]